MNKNDAVLCLSRLGYIVILWHYDDVILRAKDKGVTLTEYDAKSILSLIKQNHDCNHGITWDHIDDGIDQFVRELVGE